MTIARNQIKAKGIFPDLFMLLEVHRWAVNSQYKVTMTLVCVLSLFM